MNDTTAFLNKKALVEQEIERLSNVKVKPEPHVQAIT